MEHAPVSQDPLPMADPKEGQREKTLPLSQFFSQLPPELRGMVYVEIFLPVNRQSHKESIQGFVKEKPSKVKCRTDGGEEKN
jgi:hypothetical protein